MVMLVGNTTKYSFCTGNPLSIILKGDISARDFSMDLKYTHLAAYYFNILVDIFLLLNF